MVVASAAVAVGWAVVVAAAADLKKDSTNIVKKCEKSQVITVLTNLPNAI